MVAALQLSASLATLLVVLPAVRGHMSIWDPSVYGFNSGDSIVNPLSGKSFNDWWFHGQVNDQPSGVKTIVPGQNLQMEIACSKEWTSFGGSPNADACPNDSGSYHAGGSTGSGDGWGSSDESMLMGCALAIAFKSNPQDVQPEDFTVMSIQERCVRQRETDFSIPANLPACPDGECTCAWFWQGQNSDDEMYMTAFRCNVQGGASGGIPTPAAPRRGQISGATQPIYWANDRTNLDYTPAWETKPSYNSAFGWTNGAQTGAFGAAGGNAGASSSAAGNSTASTASTAAASALTASAAAPTGSSAATSAGANDNEWYNEPTSASESAPANTATWYNHAVDPIASSSSAAPASAAEPVQTDSSENVPETCTRRKKHGKHRSRAHVLA